MSDKLWDAVKASVDDEVVREKQAQAQSVNSKLGGVPTHADKANALRDPLRPNVLAAAGWLNDRQKADEYAAWAAKDRDIWGRGLERGAVRPGAPGNVAVDARRYEDPRLAYNRQELAAAMRQAQARQSPQMTAATIDQGPQSAMAARQMALAGALEAGGPSATAGMFGRSRDAAIKQAMAGGRPTMAGGAMASGLSEQAGQIGQARSTEQMDRQALASGLASGARGADIGLAAGQAGLQQQSSEQNLAGRLQTRQQIDDLTRYYTSTGLTLEQAQRSAWQEYDRQRVEAVQFQAGVDRSVLMAEDKMGWDAMAGVASAAGTMVGQFAAGAAKGVAGK